MTVEMEVMKMVVDLVILLSSRVKVVIAPLHIGCATITTTVRISAMSLAVVPAEPISFIVTIMPVSMPH